MNPEELAAILAAVKTTVAETVRAAHAAPGWDVLLGPLLSVVAVVITAWLTTRHARKTLKSEEERWKVTARLEQQRWRDQKRIELQHDAIALYAKLALTASTRVAEFHSLFAKVVAQDEPNSHHLEDYRSTLVKHFTELAGASAVAAMYVKGEMSERLLTQAGLFNRIVVQYGSGVNPGELLQLQNELNHVALKPEELANLLRPSADETQPHA